MFRKALCLITFIFISLSLFISCDFLENELNLRSSSRKGKESVSTILVIADRVGKIKNASDPPLTYTYSPDPLPDGVSLTGELERDPGEVSGTYVIRHGTLSLTGKNASKYSINFIVGVFSIYDD